MNIILLIFWPPVYAGVMIIVNKELLNGVVAYSSMKKTYEKSGEAEDSKKWLGKKLVESGQRNEK